MPTPPAELVIVLFVIAVSDWNAAIANVANVDLSEAISRKYGSGCPGCGGFICTCADAEKP